MPETSKVTLGDMVMTWDAEARLAVISFERPVDATGQEASALVEALTNWLGFEDEPFGLLSDGEKLRSVDAQYRAVWGGFFSHHRRIARVAFYNMGPVIRIAAEMFGIGTRLQLKAFAKEEEARAWLRKMGIKA